MTREAAFHEELVSLYRRTGEATGYWPNRYLQAVRRNGGLIYAKRLLEPQRVHSGFGILIEKRRIDLSVEFAVIDPRFHSLFSEAEVAVAHQRLDEAPLSASPVTRPSELFPEELSDEEELVEGTSRRISVNAYERNPRARAACLKHYGAVCQVCGMDFNSKYGEVGQGFMHVHHKRPIAMLKANYTVNPLKDLVPVCPNCHAMLHRREPPFDVEQLRTLVK
jgi:5-methylcytosine-specific restriction protein A